jgi:hypothetical protein
MVRWLQRRSLPVPAFLGRELVVLASLTPPAAAGPQPGSAALTTADS